MEKADMNIVDYMRKSGGDVGYDVYAPQIRGLAEALNHLHKVAIHRDIKPENCMVNKNTMVLKLCDFGSTRTASSTAPYTEYVSTRWYRAPECILTSGSYGPEVDEWAVGCMLYELMTSRPLFPGKHEIDQIGKIHNVLGSPAREVLAQFKRNPNTQISFAFPQRSAQDLHKILPKAMDKTIQLLAALLTYNPQQRVTAADALSMEAFSEIRAAEASWESSDQSLPFPAFYLRMETEQRPVQRPMAKPIRSQVPEAGKEEVRQNDVPKKGMSHAKFGQAVIQTGPAAAAAAAAAPVAQQKPKRALYSPPPKPIQQGYEEGQRVFVPPAPEYVVPSKPKVAFGGAVIVSNEKRDEMAPEVMVTNHQFQPLLISKPKKLMDGNNNGNGHVKHPVIGNDALYVPLYQRLNQMPSVLIQGMSVKPPVKATELSLMESRIRAAQRIKAYQQQLQAHKGYKKPPPFHGAAFQFAAGKAGGFQRPRADLIQPRLPKIVL
jgi:renal tumor antigen